MLYGDRANIRASLFDSGGNLPTLSFVADSGCLTRREGSSNALISASETGSAGGSGNDRRKGPWPRLEDRELPMTVFIYSFR